MIDPKQDRPFSDDPYSDLPCDSAPHSRREHHARDEALGALCAEAQADGVPCYELGRDCEMCERAYLSWADAKSDRS